MLQELSIKNFTIIDDLKISFSDGLTVLSGETGAGKSIIINAVNLLLGGRATSKLVRTDAESAELEALFAIPPNSPVYKSLEESDYSPADGLLIRRVISSRDRHRVYINGHLSTIQQLISLTENIASISGQHAHQYLLREEQHLLILDQFAGLLSLRNQVYGSFHELLPMIEKLHKLFRKRTGQAEHIELLEFQMKEITDAAISSGEDEALEKEMVRLKNAAALYETVHNCIEEIYTSRGSIIERLGVMEKSLEKAGRIDPELTARSEGMTVVNMQLEDIVEELRRYLQNIEADNGRLEAVEERLSLLSRLKRKYGKTLYGILDHHKAISEELLEEENLEEIISDTESAISRIHENLSGLASQLSEKRNHASINLAKKVEKELGSLKMARTRFGVLVKTNPVNRNHNRFLVTNGCTLTENGIDKVNFLIAPNIGEAMKPLVNIASGGELSRVILALKAILAKTDSVETIVFDEVDAGIGGGVAEVVGKKLLSLSRHHQTICITHLPQIAKFADHHYRISKSVSGGRTKTRIDPLCENERIDEIARMLGGEKITRATLDHAREM